MYTLRDFLIKVGHISPEKICSNEIFCGQTDANTATLINMMNDSLNSYCITLVKKGNCTVACNDRLINLSEKDIFLTYPGQFVKITDISDTYIGNFIMITDITAFENGFARNIIRAESFSNVRFEEPFFSLNDSTYRRLCSLFEGMMYYRNSSNALKELAMKSLFSIFLIELLDFFHKTYSDNSFSKKKELYVIKFLSLVPNHFREHHEIEFYAHELCITPVYLSRIVKEITGQTVKNHIYNMLTVEASWLLTSTHYNIKEIASRLHFSDQASFSKFFKRMKGLSPKEYRD